MKYSQIPPNFPAPDIERAHYLIRDLHELPAAFQLSSFLDMGAGSGSMSAVVALQFPLARGVLVDVSSRLTLNKFLPAEDAKRLQGLDWPAHQELKGRQFDLVLCMDVLEHVPKWREATQNLFQYVKEGGYLYIQTPSNHPSPNWTRKKIWINALKGLVGKNNPANHVRHGLSCKAILDVCHQDFKAIVAAEDYIVDGKCFCNFKPRTHLLLRKTQ